MGLHGRMRARTGRVTPNGAAALAVCICAVLIPRALAASYSSDWGSAYCLGGWIDGDAGVEVPDNAIVTDVDVRVEMAVDSGSDFDVYLYSPSHTGVWLGSLNAWGTGDYDDEEGFPRPLHSLATFDGEQAQGWWLVYVSGPEPWGLGGERGGFRFTLTLNTPGEETAPCTPDGLIHNGSAYIGDGILNTSGAGQAHSHSVETNAKASYYIRFYNDGDRAAPLRVTGRGGNSTWMLSYFDTTVNSAGDDITRFVEGAGWLTPNVPVGSYRRIRLEVTPLRGAAAGATLSALVTATSVGDPTKKDAVKADTTCALTHRLDGLIYNGSTYLGDEVFNTTGYDQTHSRTVGPNTAAAYLARFYNDGHAADTMKVVGTKGNSAWQVRYIDYSSGSDITGAVTGTGWTTPSVAARGYRAIRVEVTPLSRAAGNSSFSVLLKGTSVGDGTKKDAVKATTTCSPAYQPDGLIYNGSTYLGDGIYNTSASGQTYGQQVASGRTATYQMRFYNDGNMAQRLKITGTAGNSKWTVKYADYATGADITASVTGAGWQTGTLAPGAYVRLKVLVTPGASAAVGATASILVTATSTVDATKKDVVKASTTRK